MRKLLLFLFLCSTQFVEARTWNHINPILGDQSYILKYGEVPNEFTPDQVRIATHLEYAEFVLRSKDVSEMSIEQIQKRTHLLDLLHEYWTRGIFPNNSDEVDERRPCFIDHNGTICAVGYLIEQTAGHDVAELINERFMYNEILEMNDPVVINWIEECGLTREECAMIQPGYHYHESSWHVAYGASYRVDDYFYHTFEVFHDEINSGWPSNGRGNHILGVTLDLLRNDNFSTGLKYTKRIRARKLERKLKLSPNLFIQPEAFRYNSAWGMNLRPGCGLTQTWGAFTTHIGYSYAIPILEEAKYGAGRHDFTLKVDLNLSKIKLPKIPKKPKEEKPADA